MTSHETKNVVARARTLLENGEAILLDVRTPDEFRERHIPGAMNIPVHELPRRLHEVATRRSVVVYCRSGGRSASASQMLRSAGHEVVDIGAMSNW